MWQVLCTKLTLGRLHIRRAPRSTCPPSRPSRPARATSAASASAPCARTRASTPPAPPSSRVRMNTNGSASRARCYPGRRVRVCYRRRSSAGRESAAHPSVAARASRRSFSISPPNRARVDDGHNAAAFKAHGLEPGTWAKLFHKARFRGPRARQSGAGNDMRPAFDPGMDARPDVVIRRQPCLMAGHQADASLGGEHRAPSWAPAHLHRPRNPD